MTEIYKSAFGVEHTVVDKADKKRYQSGGRTATTVMFPGYHGLVAGKKGKKARAAANEAGSMIAGTYGGELAGAGLGALAAPKARSAGALIGTAVGGVAGGVAGALHGQKRNLKRKYLKPVQN